jgi:hypothetical protein
MEQGQIACAIAVHVGDGHRRNRVHAPGRDVLGIGIGEGSISAVMDDGDAGRSYGEVDIPVAVDVAEGEGGRIKPGG